MKKIILIMLFFIFLLGCKSLKKYGVEDVIYMAPYNSTTIDEFLVNNSNSYFKFSNKSFVASSNKSNSSVIEDETFNNVKYLEETLINNIQLNDEENNSIDISVFKFKREFKVYCDGNDTGYRIYYINDEIWIGHFSSKEDEPYIMIADYIFKVKKS